MQGGFASALGERRERPRAARTDPKKRSPQHRGPLSHIRATPAFKKDGHGLAATELAVVAATCLGGDLLVPDRPLARPHPFHGSPAFRLRTLSSGAGQHGTVCRREARLPRIGNAGKRRLHRAGRRFSRGGVPFALLASGSDRSQARVIESVGLKERGHLLWFLRTDSFKEVLATQGSTLDRDERQRLEAWLRTARARIAPQGER
jgi:hypothetical protein